MKYLTIGLLSINFITMLCSAQSIEFDSNSISLPKQLSAKTLRMEEWVVDIFRRGDKIIAVDALKIDAKKNETHLKIYRSSAGEIIVYKYIKSIFIKGEFSGHSLKQMKVLTKQQVLDGEIKGISTDYKELLENVEKKNNNKTYK